MTQLSLLDRGPSGLPRGAKPLVRGSAYRLAVLTAAVAVAVQPVLHPTGPGNSSPVDVLTLATLVAVAVWASASRVRLRAPYAFAAGTMAVAGAASGLFGPLPGITAVAVLQDVVLVTWCIALANIARPATVRLLLRVWAWTSIGWATILAAGFFTHNQAILGITAREGNRASFTFGDPNYAAIYWVLSIFVVYAVATPARRPVRIAGYLLLLGALALTESNGGMLELAVAFTFLVLARMARRHGLVPAVATFLLVVTTVVVTLTAIPPSQIRQWAMASGQPFLVNSVGRSNGSSEQRSVLVRESFELYRQDGLLGSGPATTKPLLQMRQYPYAKEAHDDYLASLVERGPLGVLGLLGLTFSVGWRTARLLRRSPPGQPIAHPVGLVACIVVVAVAAAYYEVLHFRFVWVLFALVAAVAETPGPVPGVRRA
ncbi:MAG TPA: O-antigen ligase family protein [Streptosporangiales bacterium]